MKHNTNLVAKNEYISFLSLFSIFNKKNIVKTLLITLLFLFLGMLYFYFTTPRYISHVSLEVDATAAKQKKVATDDLISSIHAPSISDIETEMDVLHSDLLVSKALAGISDSVSYYDANGIKKFEFYDNSPIVLEDVKVYDKKIFNRMFLVSVVDDNHFEISENKPLLSRLSDAIPFIGNRNGLSGKIYQFGQNIKSKMYAFKIKNRNVIQGKTYAFVIRYQPDLIKSVKKNLNVKPASARSSVISISYEDNNPYRVRDFLELLSYEYIKQNINQKSKNASSTLKFLDMQVKTVKEQLKESSDKLKRYKESNNFLDINTKSREVVDKLVEYDKQYAEAKLQYQSFMMLKRDLNRGNFTAISGFSKEYPILENLVRELQTARSEKIALLTTLTNRHPNVIAVTQKIDNIKKSIRSVALGVEQNLKQRQSTLKRMVHKENKVMENLPEKEQNLANLERLFGVNEKLFSYLLQRQSELSLLQASKVSDIRILDKASVQLKPAKPNKIIVLITSLFLGLVFSFLASLTKYNKKIKTVEDLSEHTDIPLYGIIPYVENKMSYNSAYVLEDASSTASEAFRAVRTNLDYIVSPNGSKVILVTSNIPNEGKTVVSANLASVIGMSEKRVIMLSLDLRRPEMHHKFGLSNKVGMSDILSGKAALKDAIWEHEMYTNLNIITSGRIPPNPAELLASTQMKNVIQELTKEYDYIIMDTPPINYVADAISLFKHADMNLFVVKSDFTEEKYIDQLNTLVEKFGLDNSGIILNSVKKKYNKVEQFDYKYLYYEPL